MQVKRSSIIEFRERFSSKEKCEKFLLDEKTTNGFQCNRCGNDTYLKGYNTYDIRCKKCKYNESPSSNTLFHSCKLSLPIAFEMVYRISVNKKGMSALGLCREYDINPKTANNFKRKVQFSMESSGASPLSGLIQVDEFMYGGKDEGCQGRSSKSDKLKICLALEIIEGKKNKMGRAYAVSIENFSNEELSKIFDKHIDSKAKIITDKWTGYVPLKAKYNIEQILSDSGKNFPELHVLILNIKNWIRGIHHKISKKHLQKYLNEFFFRFNRRTFLSQMPIFALKRMTQNKPKPVILSVCGFYG